MTTLTDTIREALRRCPVTENGWTLDCAEDYGNTVWFWSKRNHPDKPCGNHYATAAMTAAWVEALIERSLDGDPVMFYPLKGRRRRISHTSNDLTDCEGDSILHALAAAVVAVMPEASVAGASTVPDAHDDFLGEST